MEETKEIETFKPEKVTLMIKGKEREIFFGFSAWAKLEKEMGGLKNLTKLQEQIENEPFSTIPRLLYLGLTDKEGVTEENVLDEYGLNDIQMVTEKFTKALYGSLPVNKGKKAAEQEATKIQ